MRIAYLECFAGISGDMFLGALLGAGVPADVLHGAIAALKIGAHLKIETVDRSGISATKVHVLEGGELAESLHEAHAGSDGEDEHLHQREIGQIAYTQAPKTQHLHKGGHTHAHPHSEHSSTHGDTGSEAPAHPHVHGRSLTTIREIIRGASLPEAVKSTSLRAFELLGHAEAHIHNVPVESIHFHEVGAVDAIVDIVAASAGIHHLNVGKWFCSEVNVGGGMVQCAHGNFPVPAPATADLLRGVPTYSAHVQKELTTPTGAALLRALDPVFGAQPRMQVEAIGYGAGTRNPEGFPNVLRLSVGDVQEASVSEPSDSASEPASGSALHEEAHPHDEGETVTVLETALDDLSPQLIAYAAEKVLAAGALDVMLTPVVMKKGRPGTLLTVLCKPEDSAAMQGLLLRETSTLGLRIRQDRRACLERTQVSVETAYGAVRIKIGSEGGEERNAAPEFEDCRAAAERHNVPLKLVQQAAIAAHRSRA